MSEYTNLINVYKFKGIDKFYDISPLLESNTHFMDVCRKMIKSTNFDCVCGLDARGFIFGITIANLANVPFYMIRKNDKLPNSIESPVYEKEYKSDNPEGDKLCISKDAKLKDKRVLIVDDSIATGGTMLTAYNLIKLFEPSCIIGTVFLKLDTCKIDKFKIHSVVNEKDLKFKFKICVCSTNTIKISAVRDALFSDLFNTEYICNNVYIYHKDSPSGVYKQPYGFDEIYKGAKNRIEYCKNDCEIDYDLLISFENGVVEINKNYFDVCCAYVSIKTENNKYIDSHIWSEMVKIDDSVITEAKENNQTIGQIINPRCPSDPHNLLTTGYSHRKAILEKIFINLIGNCIYKGQLKELRKY